MRLRPCAGFVFRCSAIQRLRLHIVHQALRKKRVGWMTNGQALTAAFLVLRTVLRQTRRKTFALINRSNPAPLRRYMTAT